MSGLLGGFAPPYVHGSRSSGAAKGDCEWSLVEVGKLDVMIEDVTVVKSREGVGRESS